MGNGQGIVIHTDFPDPTERALIEQICRACDRTAVHVSRLRRYGASGARLLVAHFARECTGLPFIIKISPWPKTKIEFEAIERLWTHVRDCRLVHKYKFGAEPWGGLLFEHVGTDDGKDALGPRTLSSCLFDHLVPWIRTPIDGASASQPIALDDNALVTCIVAALDRLRTAHAQFSWREEPLGTQYQWYFREHRADARLRMILGDGRTLEPRSFLGEQIISPIGFLQSLRKPVPTPVGIAHGDLHPDNIVLDNRNSPRLIDFEWGSTERDVLVDYVLMENAIRFRHFPKSTNVDEQRAVDAMLLDFDGPAKVIARRFTDDVSTCCFHRLAKVVQSIRGRAQAVVGRDFTWERYLLSQFLVLYGLMCFDQYGQFVATRALGMVAKRLADSRRFS